MPLPCDHIFVNIHCKKMLDKMIQLDQTVHVEIQMIQ